MMTMWLCKAFIICIIDKIKCSFRTISLKFIFELEMEASPAESCNADAVHIFSWNFPPPSTTFKIEMPIV
jgi:hypothetical protein